MLEAAREIERLRTALASVTREAHENKQRARFAWADAERYLWLRDGMTGDNAHRVHDETCSNLLTGPSTKPMNCNGSETSLKV